MDSSRKVATMALTATAAGLLLACIYKRWKGRNKPPKSWKAVGKVTELFCFPIKSCGVVRLNSMDCGTLGPESALLRDRSFIILNGSTKKVITARQQPKLLKIHPTVEGSKLILNAPDMPTISVDIDDIKNNNQKGRIEYYDWTYDYLDAGEDISQWLSRFILGNHEGNLRLGFYPYDYPTRAASNQKRNDIFPDMSDEHAGALADESSYMIINESSIEDLNSKLTDKNVSALWFRPNIVFNGLPAFAEDKIKWFKIGEKAVFKALRPCIRCTFTTIDPDTAEKDPKNEPLRTLRTYRLLPKCEMSPGMGIHLGVTTSDTIKVGDTIYIPK